MSRALEKIAELLAFLEEEDKKTNIEDDRFTLAYWKFQGLAGSARLMFAYAGVKYNDITYVERDEWTNVKFKMDFDFPNLPYLIDKKMDYI